MLIKVDDSIVLPKLTKVILYNIPKNGWFVTRHDSDYEFSRFHLDDDCRLSRSDLDKDRIQLNSGDPLIVIGKKNDLFEQFIVISSKGMTCVWEGYVKLEEKAL